ncbi:glycosyltransferase family 39 protein [Microbacterium sp. NPDC077184]|uniref:glycosyltransferase family 39 protein n=1 Tax=Microbacterium sp. NPDC077184 TaxID=3154764 RepID=UPI003416F96C
MSLWTFSRATLTAQDERAHVSAVLYAHEFQAWPGFKEMPLMLSAMRAAEEIGGSPFAVDEAKPRPERPSFRELTTPENHLSATTLNQMSQHPPLYYAGLAVLHELVAPGDLPFDLEIWAWRFLSVVLIAPLPLLAAALARRLGASRLMVIAAAASTALIPGVQVVAASVNNDNLLVAASAWALLGVGCVLTGDLRFRTSVGIGVALAIALLTKAFALPIAAVAGSAYLLVAVRRGSLRPVVGPLLTMVVVSATGWWWWVRNLFIYGTLQPSGHGQALQDGPLAWVDAWPIYFHTFVDRFFARYWLGANGPTVGAIGVSLAAAVTLLYVGVLVVLLARGKRHRRAVANALVLSAPLFVMATIVAVQSYRYTVVTGVAAGVQGRYLYPALIGAAAAFALVASIVLRDSFQRVALSAILAAGLAATLWRILIAIFSSWGATGASFLERLDAIYSWSPLPYGVSIAVHAVFTVSVVAVVVAAVTELVTPRAEHAVTAYPEPQKSPR